MGLLNNRLDREKITLLAMLRMYCSDHHSESERALDQCLCGDCAELWDYAQRRLEKCPYGAGKTACNKCPTHCYKPEMRERVRAAMRYAGPRMIRRHPLLAILHLLAK